MALITKKHIKKKKKKEDRNPQAIAMAHHIILTSHRTFANPIPPTPISSPSTFNL